MAVNSYDPITGRPIFLDTDAPDIKVDPTAVGVYAADVGNVIVRADLAALGEYPYKRKGLLGHALNTGILYSCDGSGWKPMVEPELRPTSVVGGTIDSTGAIIPNTGANLIRVNGLFSPRYRTYEVEWALNFSAPAATSLNLTQNGVAYTAASYSTQRLSAVDTAVSATRSQSQSSWPGAGMTGVFLQGSWKFTNPYHLGPKYVNIDVQPAVGVGLAVDRGWLGGADSSLFDGIEFRVSGQTINGGGTSFLRVRGLG